jgi:hypothetical protein
MKSIKMLSFVDHAFGVLPKKSSLDPRPSRFSPVILQKSYDLGFYNAVKLTHR